MKRFFEIFVLVGLLGGLFAAVFANEQFAGAASATAEHTVVMKSLSYAPKTLEIKVHDTVIWANQAYTEHSATSDTAGEFDTGMVSPGKNSKKIEFSKPGTYSYHCTMHGKTMSGQIIVQP